MCFHWTWPDKNQIKKNPFQTNSEANVRLQRTRMNKSSGPLPKVQSFLAPKLFLPFTKSSRKNCSGKQGEEKFDYKPNWNFDRSPINLITSDCWSLIWVAEKCLKCVGKEQNTTSGLCSHIIYIGRKESIMNGGTNCGRLKQNFDVHNGFMADVEKNQATPLITHASLRPSAERELQRSR